MSCSGATNYATAADQLWTAVSNFQFVDAFTCTFANAAAGPAAGLAVVGTLIWFTIVTMSYIRTDSFAMPMVLTLLFGGAALSQVVAPVLGFASVLILGGFALVVVLIARRMNR